MELQCKFNRYLYYDRISHSGIIRVKRGAGDYLIGISKGCLIPPNLTEGTVLSLSGDLGGSREKYYPFYSERGFFFTSLTVLTPSDEAMAVDYIAKLGVKGIKENCAKRIVDITGADVKAYFDSNPSVEDFLKKLAMPLIKKSTIERLIAKLAATEVIKELAQKIAPAGIEYKDAENLYMTITAYAQKDLSFAEIDKLLSVRKEEVLGEPSLYDYCRGAGIVFSESDRIAKLYGYRPYDLNRRLAYVQQIMDMFEAQGNTWSPLGAIVAKMERMCDRTAYPYDIISGYAVYATICSHPDLFVVEGEGERIYKSYLWHQEKRIAYHLKRISQGAIPLNYQKDILAEIEKESGFVLSSAQKDCFEFLRQSGVKIVTGNAGTGKTTIISGILSAYTALNPGKSVALCAPTGRAAQRMTELCSKYGSSVQASTMHKMLDFKPFGRSSQATYNEENPLPADLFIIDEMSMTDTFVFSLFLSAVKTGALVVLCGDVDQLPSVAAGKVFGDLIESGLFPVVRLTKNYRQKDISGNLILENAEKINKGRHDITTGKNFSVIMCKSEEEIQQRIIELMGNYSKAAVLSSVHKGPAGIDMLNDLIQPIKNKSDDTGVSFGHHVYRTGDYVIMQNNNYALGYVNGDSGIITSTTEDQITVLVNGENKEIPRDWFKDISLGYAMTIHKGQGQEFDSVIIALPASNKNMLARNLLYTAITRAKKEAIIVAEEDAIDTAIDNTRITRRRTTLQECLKEVFSS